MDALIEISQDFNQENSFLPKLLFWVFFVAAIRAMILWFQTFIDALSPKTQDNAKVGWIICHFLLCFLASYLYYFIEQGGQGNLSLEEQEREIKRRANRGELR